MPTPQQRIESLGGISSLRQLVGLGAYRDLVLLMAWYGKIVRVREGWYALHGDDETQLRAWRLGGRLACVSALAYYGCRDEPAEVHVEVRGNASRLREAGAAIVHWTRHPSGGNRRVVSIATAERQASRCSRGS
jgi:hypothetical protein